VGYNYVAVLPRLSEEGVHQKIKCLSGREEFVEAIGKSVEQAIIGELKI